SPLSSGHSRRRRRVKTCAGGPGKCAGRDECPYRGSVQGDEREALEDLLEVHDLPGKNSAIVRPTTSAAAVTSATMRRTSWLVRPHGTAPSPSTISLLST